MENIFIINIKHTGFRNQSTQNKVVTEQDNTVQSQSLKSNTTSFI